MTYSVSWVSRCLKIGFVALIVGMLIVPATTYAALWKKVFAAQDSKENRIALLAQVQKASIMTPKHSGMSLFIGRGGPAGSVQADRGLLVAQATSYLLDDIDLGLSDNIDDIVLNDIVATSGRKYINHIVEPGDTLSGIADLYGVSVKTIEWENELLGKKYIRAGQELKIWLTDGFEYKIKKGDTLGGISNRAKADLGDILTHNDITTATPLRIGQALFIPGGTPITQTVITQGGSTSKVSIKAERPKSTRVVAGSQVGDLIWPTSGIVTQGYGNTSFARRSGYYKNDFHGGIDIGAPTGTPIYSVLSGTVIYSGSMRGYGNVIIVKHDNGYFSRYGHNSKNLVKKGDRVDQGQEIAKMGATGRATGPHLHFEIRDKNDKHLESATMYQQWWNY